MKPGSQPLQSTRLLDQLRERIGYMPCNPAPSVADSSLKRSCLVDLQKQYSPEAGSTGFFTHRLPHLIRSRSEPKASQAF